MFSTISSEIYDIVNWLVASTKLASVYNYEVKQYDSVPCATIQPLDSKEIVLDTASNFDTIPFLIRVVDKNSDIANMEARMRTLCDDIMTELRKKENITLQGTVCWSEFSISWGWIDDTQPMRTFEITMTTTSTNVIN